ncbi:hypothetical protein [Streptococcus dysgalactiae]|uniref:hyaluronate lyase N-terminal domain-containing protein n=1 Tax=Streptococcus dysgalactiae TaxID=1334 RepID=UPI003F541627
MTLEERIPIKVLFDRKDASEWQSTNPVIDAGEMVVELDTHRLKVGDGKLNYNDLPYYEGPQGESITKVQLSENGDLSVWIGDQETKLGNIKGQKGDKGTSITDIIKEGETLTITLSDDTQKTFNIPNGQKGDKGDSVESVRVDESGNFYVTIEGQSEKLLGNIKGGKGDKGDALKFEDLTPDQIAQIKAKDVDLSAYVTKAELKTAGLADVKGINDFLGLSQKVFTSNYSYSDSLLKSYSSPSYSASWYVNESTKDVSVRDKVLITITNTTTRVDNYLEVSVTYVGSNYVTATSTGKLLTTPGEVNVLTKEQIAAAYAKKEHKHTVSDIADLNLDQYATKAELKRIELTPGPKGSDGAPGLDGPIGATGPAGVGITNTTIRYATGTIGTTVPRYGEWFTSPPYVPEGQFLWTEVVWQYSNGTTQTAYSVSKMGEQGPIGPQGPPGQQGNPGRPGRDAVLNVEVVSSAPSYQQPNVIYLVKG